MEGKCEREMFFGIDQIPGKKNNKDLIWIKKRKQESPLKKSADNLEIIFVG